MTTSETERLKFESGDLGVQLTKEKGFVMVRSAMKSNLIFWSVRDKYANVGNGNIPVTGEVTYEELEIIAERKASIL